MERNQLSFNTDIAPYVTQISKTVKIENTNFTLRANVYEDKEIIRVIEDWKTCLDMMGKTELFKNPNIMCIIYCMMTDCVIINDINRIETPIDMFNMALEKFLLFSMVDDANRNIKIRMFPIVNTMIVIDAHTLKQCLIYEVHNLAKVKAKYGKTVNFDKLRDDLGLKPSGLFTISTIRECYKKYASSNISYDYMHIVKNLDKLLKHSNEVEQRYQMEYRKFYKLFKLNAYKI